MRASRSSCIGLHSASSASRRQRQLADLHGAHGALHTHRRVVVEARDAPGRALGALVATRRHDGRGEGEQCEQGTDARAGLCPPGADQARRSARRAPARPPPRRRRRAATNASASAPASEPSCASPGRRSASPASVPSDASSRTRTACVASAPRHVLGQHAPRSRGGSGSAPCSASSAGRANSTNVTKLETGLPGRPKTSCAPRVPNQVGLPGCRSTRQKRSATPSAVERRLDVVVRPDGHAARERRRRRPARAPPRARPPSPRACRRRRPRSTTSAPACARERGQHGRVRVVDLAGPERAAGRAQLVAGARIATRGRRAHASVAGARADRDAQGAGAEHASRRRARPSRRAGPRRRGGRAGPARRRPSGSRRRRLRGPARRARPRRPRPAARRRSRCGSPRPRRACWTLDDLRATRPTIRSAPLDASLRTAKPSMAELSKWGTSATARRSAASTRPPASSTLTGSAASGAHLDTTSARAASIESRSVGTRPFCPSAGAGVGRR